MHNKRIKEYHDGSKQITYYGKPIKAHHDRFDPVTGEIFKPVRSDGCITIENPFTGELERVKDCTNDNSEKKKYDNYNRAKNKVYDIARCNAWEWFTTFTFSKEYVDRYNYDACKKKISKWLNNIKAKNICPDMKYLIVPEQHKDGAWHFHGLFADCDGFNFIDSGIRDKQKRVVYNIGRYKWGFTTATKVSDSKKAASYLCKYITKELVADTKGMKRYWSSKNCNVPVVTDELIEGRWSKDIEREGYAITHVKEIETPYNNVVYVEVL